jgi:ribonuclease Z
MLDVCLLGTGGMMPLPHRSLTSLMLRLNGSSLMVDCGEGTQVTLKEQGWSPKPLDTICFTHYHADHISGLPGMLLTMGNAERTEPLLLIGPKGLERVVNALRVIAPELPFPIVFHELREKEETLQQKDYRIQAYQVNHGVPCYGYSFEVKRAGRFLPEKAMEFAIPQKYWSRLQKGEVLADGDKIFRPEMVLGPERKGIKLTYCTDSRPTESILRNAAGADLFICEGMYGEKDKIAKAKEYKHMTMYEAAQLAQKAGVKELWLTHYSPSMVRPAEYKDEVNKIFSPTILSKDRRTVTLDFEA